ncbi:CNNM domain-containing protein [Halanaeroarchaeum sulfurireducens]|nr:hemolysin family protein [Halanaeroarchaeum sulfurireducens]
MNSIEIVIRLLAGVGLILTNGFFVAIEFALTRARQYDKDEFLGDRSSPGLERAWEMTQDLELYLTSCQVGITASSIAVGIVAEPALAAMFEPLFADSMLASIGSGAILAFLLINLVHLTHGEQTPTYLGVERSRWVSKYGAIPLYWFHRILSPIIALGDGIAKGTLRMFGVEMTGAWLETEQDVIETRSELRNRLGTLLDKGDLPEERREEIMNALTIGEQPVREVMVPAEDIVALSTAASVNENLERIANQPQTRYPLIGEALSDFRGIVYVPVLAKFYCDSGPDSLDFEKIAAPPLTVPADEDVSHAIDLFQAENQELALVVEDETVIGLVTVTDLLESVMGDVEDPIDVSLENEDTTKR